MPDAGDHGRVPGLASCPGFPGPAPPFPAGCSVAWTANRRPSFPSSCPSRAILGSVVLQVKDLASGEAAALPFWPVLVGIVAAALSSLFAIKFMLYLVKKANLAAFAVYTLALGVLVCIDQWWTHLFF